MADIQPSGVLPFLKWAGGKRAMVPTLFKYIPDSWDPKRDLYIEPFLGSGALFFALAPPHAVLTDLNEVLIETYEALQEEWQCYQMGQSAGSTSLFSRLAYLEERHRKEGRACYTEVREALNLHKLGSIPTAAFFIFVNRAGFNGLWRVNKKGEMNTPWGKNPNVKIFHKKRLLECMAVLSDSRSLKINVDDALDPIGYLHAGRIKNALIYLDPPYTPVSKTSNFTAYTSEGFTRAHQFQLLDQMCRWRDRGAHILLTQAADPELLQAYENAGFNTVEVSARRAINSKVSARGPVSEYIIWHHHI